MYSTWPTKILERDRETRTPGANLHSFQVAFNLVFTVGGATNVSGAVLCGILVDSCGPRGGILTGLVLIMVTWIDHWKDGLDQLQ